MSKKVHKKAVRKKTGKISLHETISRSAEVVCKSFLEELGKQSLKKLIDVVIPVILSFSLSYSALSDPSDTTGPCVENDTEPHYLTCIPAASND